MGCDRKRLLRLCIFIKVLCCSLGFSYVSGDYCDPKTANVCYEELLHYETLAFPLYGEDKAKLEETCAIINSSYDCLDQFILYCSEKTAECDEECQILMHDAKRFTKFRALENLYGVLCSPDSVLSTIYLENVDCLYSIADSYASCHNDSQKSLHYLSTQPPSLKTRCCFFKWHEECFINATSDRCGDNATFFISFATHTLMGNLAQKLCLGVESTCTRPPLPSEDHVEVTGIDGTGYGIDDEEHGIDYEENGIDHKGHGMDDEEHVIAHKEHGIDDAEHGIEDKDNRIDHGTTESQTESDRDNEIDKSKAVVLRSYATNWIVLPFLYILLSKYAL